MKNKIHITIGIPAYNEEVSIKRVLDSLLRQKHEMFVLDEIIVVSDGSTDETDTIVMSYKNQKIRLVKNKKRMGKNYSLNYLFKHVTSTLLVILDADVQISDTRLVSKLVKN
jgi:glycosyltransferase involved in cell wall biosynthesis